MRMFPVLKSTVGPYPAGQLAAVPWDLLAPHERQADINHGQTLKRLAERGGLSPAEMVAVLEDRRFHRMEPAAAIVRLNEIIKERLG